MELGTQNESGSTLLAVVPEKVYEDCTSASSGRSGRIQSNNQVYEVEFNVAIWLRFTEAPVEPVSVSLQYSDSKGTKEVFIDKGMLRSSKHLMLSAKVAVRFRGAIKQMKVTCAGNPFDLPHAVVDELYIQPVKNIRSLSSTGSGA